VALARTDEIVYRYGIHVYAFIGCSRPNRERKTNDQWARTALNGTTPLSSDAQVPRKFLTAPRLKWWAV
jgi:hypothetical protein